VKLGIDSEAEHRVDTRYLSNIFLIYSTKLLLFTVTSGES
jgi:hypothetical protein